MLLSSIVTGCFYQSTPTEGGLSSCVLLTIRTHRHCKCHAELAWTQLLAQTLLKYNSNNFIHSVIVYNPAMAAGLQGR